MDMSTFLAIVAVQSDDDGLTLREVVDSLPTDPASLLVLVLLLVCTFAVLYFGTRPASDSGGDERDESDEVVPSTPGRDEVP